MKTTNKKSLYFSDFENEFCKTIDRHLDYMVESDLLQMTIYKAKRMIDSPYFFCKWHNEAGEKSEGGCGKECEKYQPRNGKSGICKHNGYVYEPTDECYTLTIDSIKPLSDCCGAEIIMHDNLK